MMSSVPYLVVLAVACSCLALAWIGRTRALHRHLQPALSYRCLARPLFSQLGRSSFMLDALVETSEDPAVPRGLPFSLRLIRPALRSEYLFSRVRASVEAGHALLVEVEDHLTARKARLCANGWTVVLDVEHASGWPSCGFLI
jgi:hypothetical protein